ncbi:SPX domain-containing membrane protein OsI_17046 isoform X2 [Cryptomeria japonica]|uniref:SPX domain-containing membrane protein OsI_17046 isoform X2 n=1 Tax=Cryptomeria japonica TaxID=3369 RepID=UPI0027DA45EE|nr:SPX domain-containing membrane protein OsI_17046 isoform X2 [Cryptomeria japonica]
MHALLQLQLCAREGSNSTPSESFSLRQFQGINGRIWEKVKAMAISRMGTIEKTVLFLLEQQGYLASRLEGLGEEREVVMQNNELSQVHELQQAYTSVGQDLLKLLHFIEINAIGLRKILKKFDKRIGYQFTNYYVSSRSNHPYSQLRQIFKHVGLEAVVGALSHGLVELQHNKGSYLSIYDQPERMHESKDPVIQLIKSAVERLTHSTNFLSFIGQHALIIQEELPSPPGEHVEEQDYHVMSLALNLVNTFLYMVNTYIIVPTADDYAISLGASATLCGVIVGCMPISQLVSSVFLSAWSNTSYFRPLIFSSIALFLGNILYATAYDIDSIIILLLGRLLCGFGSARAVNRRYISDCVPISKRLQSSAYFVIASALGMSCGPALAGLLQINKTFLGLTMNQSTLPGWVMSALWIFYLLWLWISFKEPLRKDDGADSVRAGNNGSVQHDMDDDSLTEPLAQSLEAREEEGILDTNGNGGTHDISRQPANSFFEAYKFVSRPVKVMLLIYFMLKYATEMVISESSVITAYYFNWTTSTVAIFLALLGLTVLPVNLILGNYIGNIFEDRQLIIAAEILTCLGILITFKYPSHYSVAQYVTGSFVTFVSAEVLEGVNLSLLSKVMSSRLARGTYNGGLLSTEAGTLARVLADLSITFVGYLGTKHLLDLTLLPSLFIGILSIAATYYTYNLLY